MVLQCETLNSQSSQIKLSPQDSINEFIIRKLNPLVVVDLRFISAHFCARDQEQ